MNWIDDRLKQRDDAYRRTVLIEQSAPTIFKNLWDAITPWVEEAKKKNMPVLTNGTPYERIVILPTPLRFGESRSDTKRLILSLAQDKSAIIVQGIGREDMRLTLDVCDDGVVCIKQDGEEVAINDVAQSLLDQFLFPEFTD